MLGRSRLVVAGIAAIVVLAGASTLASAEEMVTDPRKYCDHVAELVAAGDVDELASDLLAHTHGLVSEIEFKAGFAGFPALWAKTGSLGSHEHVAETKFGDAFVRHWYIFVYERGALFIRCAMYRPASNWLVVDFIGNSDPEKVGLKP